jgi:aminopeptidase N
MNRPSLERLGTTSGTVLDLVSGFGDERTAKVAATFASALTAIDEEFTTAATRSAYRAWVGRFIAPAVADVGVEARAGDTDEVKSLRATVVNLAGKTARDAQVLATARSLVSLELDKPRSIEPTLLGVLINLAAIDGDAALYDRYLDRVKTATDPEEHDGYMYALTSFANPLLVRRTMDLALSDVVRSQDAKYVVAALLANSDIHRLAWQLARERWAEIQKKTGEFVGNTVLVGALATFCDARTAAEVKSFFSTHKVADAERTLQQSIERIQSCAASAAVQGPKLAEWLNSPGR